MTSAATGKRRDLALHLLDRQVVGSDEGMVGNVDDVEIDEAGEVVALLTGPQALAGRLGGRLGSLLQALSEGISRRSTREPTRIPVELVTDYGTVISVSRTRQELGAGANEERFRHYLVGRIPGAQGAQHESG